MSTHSQADAPPVYIGLWRRGKGHEWQAFAQGPVEVVVFDDLLAIAPHRGDKFVVRADRAPAHRPMAPRPVI